MFVSAVIVAAGKGKRMQAGMNKQYLKILNKYIINHTLNVFQNCDEINEIILVVGEGEVDFCIEHIIKPSQYTKITKVIAGGKERQDSVFSGLQYVDPRCDAVLIHDGARPFVTEEILLRTVEGIDQYKAVAVGVKVKDTIKITDENGKVLDTPNRDRLWAVQTPQGFQYDMILQAYEKAVEESFTATDDAMLVEHFFGNVQMIEGSYENIKITTPEDLFFGEAILKNRGGSE